MSNEKLLQIAGDKEQREFLLKQRDWIWNIHKEADTLLHNRLQTFIAIQAIMFAGYFSTILLFKPVESPLRLLYATLIAVAGAILAIAFRRSNNKLLGGIEYIKKTFLISNQEDVKALFYPYREFYYNVGSGLGEPYKYTYARGLPLAVILLWLTLSVVAYVILAHMARS